MSLLSPSRAQIALAIIVLKSKPPGISTEGYINQIRSVIIHRKRKVFTDSQHYIDGTLFWKKAYEKSEMENSKLLDRIFDLEQAVERNRALPAENQAVSKRTADIAGISRANIQTKRRKVEHKATDTLLEGNEEYQLRLTIPEHHLLLRAFHRLRTSLKERRSTASTIGQSVKALSFAIGQSLQYICESGTSCRSTTFRTEEVLEVTVKSWTTLLEALKRIVELKSNLYLECVPALVHLFQKLLGKIQQECLNEADKQVRNSKKQKAKAKSKSKMVTSAMSATVPIDSTAKPWQNVCIAVTTVFCQMLGALSSLDKAQSLVFEGTCCALLDHIGSSISLLVFAQSSTTLKQQKGILPPQGLLDVAHIDSETALLTSQLAGPYTISILQQVMKVANSLNNDQVSRLLKQKSLVAEINRGLADKLRGKLQNTLLRGVYGDEDIAFTHALDRSVQPDDINVEQLLESLEQEKDKSEWFIGQVWENLGWDILAMEEGNWNT